MHLAAATSTNPSPAANLGPQRGVTPADPVANAAITATAITATAITATAITATAITGDGCWANLNAGKPLPGPDEWRALERRASSFRLR